MTNNDVIKVLSDTKKLLNTMDCEHIEKLFRIITGMPKETDTTNNFWPILFCVPYLRKNVKQLLNSYIETPHVVDCFTHKQMKQIYEIIGDYNYYPVCQLCGQPIKINSESSKHIKASSPTAFSWDHIFPKSLGGTTDLRNLQPAHKLCNNLKGSKIPEEQHVHYDINVNINMAIGCPECVEYCEKQKRKKTQQNLRKQDAFCHKQRNYRCRGY